MQSPNGESSIVERFVTTPCHGRGHGPKVAALARRGTTALMLKSLIEKKSEKASEKETLELKIEISLLWFVIGIGKTGAYLALQYFSVRGC